MAKRYTRSFPASEEGISKWRTGRGVTAGALTASPRC